MANGFSQEEQQFISTAGQVGSNIQANMQQRMQRAQQLFDRAQGNFKTIIETVADPNTPSKTKVSLYNQLDPLGEVLGFGSGTFGQIAQWETDFDKFAKQAAGIINNQKLQPDMKKRQLLDLMDETQGGAQFLGEFTQNILPAFKGEAREIPVTGPGGDVFRVTGEQTPFGFEPTQVPGVGPAIAPEPASRQAAAAEQRVGLERQRIGLQSQELRTQRINSVRQLAGAAFGEAKARTQRRSGLKSAIDALSKIFGSPTRTAEAEAVADQALGTVELLLQQGQDDLALEVLKTQNKVVNALPKTQPAAPEPTGRIEVIDAKGNRYTLPAEQIEAFLKSPQGKGFKRGR